MFVGWDGKWCPVSRITTPLAHYFVTVTFIEFLLTYVSIRKMVIEHFLTMDSAKELAMHTQSTLC